MTRLEWTPEEIEKFRRALAIVDRPRSTRPVKRNAPHLHQFIESDRCHWCGAPDELPQTTIEVKGDML